MKYINCIFIFAFSSLFSQVNFSDSKTLIDLTHYSYKITALASADLNNDGVKDLIIGSYYDNKIMLYKNINGDITHLQRQIIIQHLNVNYYSNFDIYCADIDNDGLIDIAVTEYYSNKIYWYKNLGNFNFDGERTIAVINNPKSLVIADIDNDGDNDFIVGSQSNNNVTILLNNGIAVFNEQITVYNVSYGIEKIKLFDLDNNGFLDIISGDSSGSIYWSKNIDGLNFSSKKFITGSAGNGIGFDFLDINGDSFYDIVYTSNYDDNLKYKLNQSGTSFSEETIIDNSINTPYNLIVKDFDNDGLKDIIITTINTNQDKIGWYKNNYGNFSSIIEITDKVANPRHFLIEDVDNNGVNEIIVSSYLDNDTANQKLSLFKLDNTSNSYIENIMNFYFSAVNTLKIADLDNDGNNDIISAFQSILWNKNYGNNVFSSQRLISSNNTEPTFSDIEIKDLNSDGWLDIIGASQDGRVMVYKNIDGNQFELIYSQTITDGVFQIETNDLNNNGNLDIIISHSIGDYPVSKIINNGNFDFQNASPLYSFGGNSFKSYNFKCADIDNDGDIDIIIGANDYSEIHWLKNNGNATFTKQVIASSIACDQIDIGDIDNDGDIDIVTAGSNSYSPIELNWLRNDNYEFTGPLRIDTQSLKSINLGDINNDGFLDIIGTSYESYNPFDEKIFYYLFNINSFENQATIESLGDALSIDKDIALGDLNNDNKLDIAASYYFINTVKYFINTTTLSTEDITVNNNFFIYPNPSSKFIFWNKNLNFSSISIFNFMGKLVYTKKNTSTLKKLKIDSLRKGLYILVAKYNNTYYRTKLIIK